MQQRGRSSAIRRLSQCSSHLLNARRRHPHSWFGTKTPQVDGGFCPCHGRASSTVNDGYTRPLRDLGPSTVETHTIGGRRFASRRSSGSAACLEVRNRKWLICPDTPSLASRLTSSWGRGEGGAQPSFARPPRPPTLNWVQARTRTGSMTDWVSGARLLASRDAGLLPAPRLPRSRLTLTWANDQRTIPGGHSRSHRGAPDPVLRALRRA